MPMGLKLGLSIGRGGGIPLPWTPDALGASNALWLDFSDASTMTLATTDIDKIMSKGSAGNANTFAQAPTALARPAQGANFNGSGKTFATFDGVNDYIQAQNGANGLFANIPSPYTIFFTINGWAQTLNASLMRDNQDANSSIFRPAATTGGIYTGAGLPSTPVDIGAHIFNVGHYPGNTFVRIDGGTEVSDVTAGAGIGMGSSAFKLNIAASATGANKSAVQIGELLIVNRALTTGERQQMEGYLAGKWGLRANLPAGHPYKTTSP